MNSMGNILWDEVSTIISQSTIIGKSAMVVKPIFQLGNWLNSCTPKPLKSNRAKLHREIPSSPVLTMGNKGASYSFKSVRKKVGSTIEITPKMDANK